MSATATAEGLNAGSATAIGRRGLAILGKVLTGGVVLGTASALLGRWHWILDLATSFPHIYLLAGLVGIVCLVAARCWRWAVVLAVISAANAGAVAPWLGVPPAAKADAPHTPHLRVLTANLRHGGTDVGAFLDRVRQERPDLIALQEITPKWVEKAVPLLEEYPYRVVEPEPRDLRPALFSRHPIEESRLFWIVPDTFASIRAEVNVEGQTVTVLVLHATSPQSRSEVRQRNATFDRIPELVGNLRGPVLVVGDMNATMWSPHFRRLIERAGLENGRRGFGIRATWPTQLGPLGVPIDHCLYRGPVRAVACRTVPNPGSDHRALIADFAFVSPEP